MLRHFIAYATPPRYDPRTTDYGDTRMKAVVRKDGVLIPKSMLKGVKQVEIRKSAGRIVVSPVPSPDDPIFRLGKRPVTTGVADASADHDRYLYGDK